LHLVSRTDNTLALWLYVPRYIMSYRRRRHLPRIHPHNIVVDRTRIHKRVVVDHGHAVRHSLIDVRNIRDMVDGHVVIHIRDLRHVHTRVGNVHVLHVSRTGAVPRDKHFSGPQWKPSYPAPAANSDTDAKAATADESHKRR